MARQMSFSAKALGAALLLASGGCSTLDKMAEDFEKRWENPKDVLAEMSETEPLSEEAKAELKARLAELAESGDCNDVRRAADRLLSFDETNIEARLSVADCDLKSRNLAGAKTAFKAVKEETGDVRALRGLGVIASLEGDGVEAETYLREAAALDAEDWRTWNAMGYALDQQARWEEAETAYRTAISLNDDKGAAFNNLGMSFLQQERFSDAEGAFREALKHEPELEAAQLNLRVARALDGDYAGALVGATDRERAVVLNNIGVAAMARGDFDAAKRYFRQALNENPRFYAIAFENLERARQLSANQ